MVDYCLDYEKIDSKVARQIRSNHDENLFIKYIEPAIVCIWFWITIFQIIKKIFSNLILNIGIGKNELKNERINTILERCKKRLKIKRNIKIIKQNFVKTPATIGVFDVRILVTEGFLEMDAIAITDVIMHELAHYKRKDNVVNMLSAIIKSFHWFNPVINLVFAEMRDDMEIATDEIVVRTLNKKEKARYCRVMLEVIGLENNMVKEMLSSMASNPNIIVKRVDMIALKSRFEKYSKLITFVSITIILSMCLLFYPTSYGTNEVPELYLKLDDGAMIKTSKYDKDCNTIKISKNSYVKLITKGGKTEDYVFYTKTDLNSNEVSEEYSNISQNKILFLDTGEYFYKFKLTYGNGKTVDYVIEIIVE